MVAGSSTSGGGKVTKKEPSPSGSCSNIGFQASATVWELECIQASALGLFSFASRLPVAALKPYGRTEASQLLHLARSLARSAFPIRLPTDGTSRCRQR